MSTGDGRGMSNCPLDMGGGDVQCSWKEMSSDHGRRCPVVMGGGGVQCSWEEEMSMYGGHGRGKMSSGEEKMSMSGGHVRGRCPLVMGADVQWSWRCPVGGLSRGWWRW